MKQPVKVSVTREFGNSGDVIIVFAGSDGDVQKVHAPGDCTPFTAATSIRPFLENLISTIEPADVVEPAQTNPFGLDADGETAEGSAS